MKIRIIILAVATLAPELSVHAQMPTNPSAIAPRKSTRRHSGRIIRSFTEPFKKSVAASAVTGIVMKTNVREGDIVHVGDPLATLNRRVLEASLEIAEARAESTARVDAARSQYELAKSQLESLQALEENGHTNRYELEQKRSEFDTVFSDYQAAQDEQNLAALEVKRIEAELNDRIIRSPIDGYVTEIHKQLGENLSSNEPQFATIVRLNKLRIRFYVDAQMLKNNQIGGPVVVEVGSDHKQLQGVVDYVSPVIDSDSGVGRMEVVIENKSLELQSGVVAFLNEEASARLVRTAQTQRQASVRQFATGGKNTSTKTTPAKLTPSQTRSKNTTRSTTPPLATPPTESLDFKPFTHTGSGIGRVRISDAPPPSRKLTPSVIRSASHQSRTAPGRVKLSERN